MDWQALRVSLALAAATALLLLPIGVALGRWLAVSRHRARPLVEASIALPLVLPPTVLGFYLLIALGGDSPLGQWYQQWTGRTWVFSFEGLLAASVVANLPFAILPMQRGFESIPQDLREAARTCGLGRWRTLSSIELPLAWTHVVTGLVMTVAHTLGEFGVVLMVGGNLAGETRTLSIAIYDRVQAFDLSAAGAMSAALLAVSLFTLLLTAWLTRRGRPAGGVRP